MELKKILNGVDLFEGLSDKKLEKVVEICNEKRFRKDQIIAKEGEAGDELFIITEGFVEILIGNRQRGDPRLVVSLGAGQIIGEMSLLDQGPRSASMRASSDVTVLQVISRQDLENLCQQDTDIGYNIMRNLAVDLSFKIRHRNLNER